MKIKFFKEITLDLLEREANKFLASKKEAKVVKMLETDDGFYLIILYKE